MLINIFLFLYLSFIVIFAIINTFWLKLKKDNEIFVICAEFIKLVIPIIALISLFLPSDYNSFWFMVYVSIYYILDALYNLLNKIVLKDIHGNIFNPDLLTPKTKQIITSSSLMYGLSFHLLLHNTIVKWASQSYLLNIISVIGLIFFSFLILITSFIMLFDFYTVIEFPILNKIINNIAKNIKTLTYGKLYKKLKIIDKYFVYVFKQEIDTQVKLKQIIYILNKEYLKEKFNIELSEQDQIYIVDFLSKFQNSYIK